MKKMSNDIQSMIKRYPLLPWLMIHYEKVVNVWHMIFEAFHK